MFRPLQDGFDWPYVDDVVSAQQRWLGDVSDGYEVKDGVIYIYDKVWIPAKARDLLQRMMITLEPAIGFLDHDPFVKLQLTSVMLDPAEVAQVRLLSEQLAQLDEVTHITDIFNADQTGINYEYPPRLTVDTCGTKTVWVRCGGKSKERITAMLLADATGKKYPMFLIFKRKDAETKEQINENAELRHGFGVRMWREIEPLQRVHGVQIYGNSTAWWNSDLSIRFLQYHFANRVDMNKKVLLLWDDFSAHWTPEVVAEANRLNVILAKIPPKYTLSKRSIIGGFTRAKLIDKPIEEDEPEARVDLDSLVDALEGSVSTLELDDLDELLPEAEQ
ncbi:hypothetical protein ATCC90586_001677 [Pythium insidiosum]|nr:hypothetical protein ATCC90586_001677 [Pythium insidiosum]